MIFSGVLLLFIASERTPFVLIDVEDYFGTTWMSGVFIGSDLILMPNRHKGHTYYINGDSQREKLRVVQEDSYFRLLQTKTPNVKWITLADSNKATRVKRYDFVDLKPYLVNSTITCRGQTTFNIEGKMYIGTIVLDCNDKLVGIGFRNTDNKTEILCHDVSMIHKFLD